MNERRVALITGAGSPKGIGRAIALYLAKAGYDIAVADMDAAGADAVAEEVRALGKNAVGIEANVTNETSVSAMVETAIEKLGQVDVLVNNAGITQPVTVLNTTLEDWNRVLTVNLTGTFLCSKAVLPHMQSRKYGRIVNISSVSGKRGGGVYGGAHYSAAKAGILGFAKALARECVLDGVTVNSVCPGLIATEIRKGLPEEKERATWKTIPIERPGTVEEVAAAVAFLASEDAGYITGEDIDVNGGSHMD
ncbi:3-oxoacyl-ACP reductase FabG [Oscillospiraceae bacterium MB08-C2-2]|nr:3-oxoacyl-ACP reductase FabG [Oscillospiraceae bacterium MB08-C2-2]